MTVSRTADEMEWCWRVKKKVDERAAKSGRLGSDPPWFLPCDMPPFLLPRVPSQLLTDQEQQSASSKSILASIEGAMAMVVLHRLYYRTSP